MSTILLGIFCTAEVRIWKTAAWSGWSTGRLFKHIHTFFHIHLPYGGDCHSCDWLFFFFFVVLFICRWLVLYFPNSWHMLKKSARFVGAIKLCLGIRIHCCITCIQFKNWREGTYIYFGVFWWFPTSLYNTEQ